MPEMTIIIPAYNDADGLARTLPFVVESARRNNWKIIVVNDASSDSTATVLADFQDDVLVITNNVNMGYGASIKRGILAANTEWVATLDADGQHRLEDLENMAAAVTDDHDAVIGMRDSQSHTPFFRMPGKWVLARVANFITGRKIPDINCGLRILRRDLMVHLIPITSDRFSFSTSTLICLLQLSYGVEFFPVVVEPRIGKSSVKQIRDGLYTLMLILRLIILFKPLRVFLPVSLTLMGLALLNQIYVFVRWGLDITTAPVLTGLSGLIIFFMSLLADQISGFRRTYLLQEIKLHQLRTTKKQDTE